MFKNENDSSTSSKAPIFLLGGVVLILIVVIASSIMFKAGKDDSSIKSEKNKSGLQMGEKSQSGPQLKIDNGESSVAPKRKIEEKSELAASSISFDSKEKAVKLNEKFSLSAMIDPKGLKTSAVELHVKFDPKFLKLEKVLPSDTFSLELLEPRIDNEGGTALIILGLPLGKPAADSGSIKIAEFQFQPLLAVESTEVSFSKETGATADDPKTDFKNIVSDLISSTISINSL